MVNVKKTAYVLAGIGAANWGAVELGYNLVEKAVALPVLNAIPMLQTIVYAVVGISGIYVLADVFGFVKKK